MIASARIRKSDRDRRRRRHEYRVYGVGGNARGRSAVEHAEGLRHIVGRKPEVFASAVNEPVVILAWSGPKKLLRDVFLMCKDVRWVHSRSAGLDSVLFPELVASNVPLTNGSGVFSQSLGEFALAAILYFAKDFRRMIRNQMAGVWEQFDVEEICTARRWGLWATETSAGPWPSGCTPWA